MKIVADKNIPFLAGVFEPCCDIRYLDGGGITRSDILDADALIVRTRTVCDRRLLEGSRVRFIATATIGTDHIDLHYCRDNGITVASAAGCNARGVLQYVAAALVAFSRSNGFHPAGKTLGVIGVGHVGSLVAELGRRIGMDVLCCDPPRHEAGTLPGTIKLEYLLMHSDVVTLHTPLSLSGAHRTFHLADSGFFRAMKPGAAFINTSRGEVADTAALVKTIARGRLTAAVDVWENEPAVDQELLARAILATPHIAGYSIQGKANGTAMAVNAAAAFLGLPIEGWYPPDIPPQKGMKEVNWAYLEKNAARFRDIFSDSDHLKQHPELFENYRNTYCYREEFF